MAEKYTPNKPKDAGLEARQKLGWWHAYRFLILRRISQLSIILMFLSGPIWQVWILKGNYSSSMLLDTVPLTDPLITAESLATGYLPEITTIIGALVIVVFYAIGQRHLMVYRILQKILPAKSRVPANTFFFAASQVVSDIAGMFLYKP